MATPTFSSKPTIIDDCDYLTYWTMNSGAIDNELYKQGSGSVYGTLKASGANDAYCDPPSSVDLTAKHLRVWFMFTGALSAVELKANGGIQLFVSDGTNTGYWYIHGKDTYKGGWVVLMVDTSLDCDAGTKPTMSAITRIGIRVVLTSLLRNVDNTWIDNLCYGDGYTITGGSDVDKITWDDVAAKDADTTEGWGLVQKINGIYFVNGKLTFGDDGGSGDCYFEDSNQIVVFLDERVNANLYEILVVNGTGTCKFQMGAKSGTRGISGCVVRAVGSQDFDVTAVDTDIDELKLYGCIFQGADLTSLPPNATGREVLDCTFSSCGEVLADTCVVKYCNFISAVDRGIRMSSTSNNISDCNFIGCGHGVHISVADTYPFTNLVFTNCVYDVENSTAGAVVVNCNPGSNASTYENTGGGSTTINNTKTLTVTVRNSAGLPIEGANVRIETDPGGVLVSEGQTNSSGVYQDTTYNYAGDEDVKVIVRKKGFENNQAYDTITINGLSVPFTMTRDEEIYMP